jgi:hypothetical protein
MHHQDVFSGNGAIGLELEAPMTGRALPGQQGLACPSDGRVEERFRGSGNI